MITKEKMLWSAIKFSQLILKGNVWRSVWGICMWILGLKGLRSHEWVMKVESSTIMSHDSKTTSNTVKRLTDRLGFFYDWVSYTNELLLINNALHLKRITLTLNLSFIQTLNFLQTNSYHQGIPAPLPPHPRRNRLLSLTNCILCLEHNFMSQVGRVLCHVS